MHASCRRPREEVECASDYYRPRAKPKSQTPSSRAVAPGAAVSGSPVEAAAAWATFEQVDEAAGALLSALHETLFDEALLLRCSPAQRATREPRAERFQKTTKGALLQSSLSRTQSERAGSCRSREGRRNGERESSVASHPSSKASPRKRLEWRVDEQGVPFKRFLALHKFFLVERVERAIAVRNLENFPLTREGVEPHLLVADMKAACAILQSLIYVFLSFRYWYAVVVKPVARMPQHALGPLRLERCRMWRHGSDVDATAIVGLPPAQEFPAVGYDGRCHDECDDEMPHPGFMVLLLLMRARGRMLSGKTGSTPGVVYER